MEFSRVLELTPIEAPLKNGYCKVCKNRYQGKCTVKVLYGKPVPCFAIERCGNFEKMS